MSKIQVIEHVEFMPLPQVELAPKTLVTVDTEDGEGTEDGVWEIRQYAGDDVYLMPVGAPTTQFNGGRWVDVGYVRPACLCTACRG